MNGTIVKPIRQTRPPRRAETLPPFDPQLRHTVDEATQYLKTSRPTIYKLIREGRLEVIKEGRRTFITGRSIAARSLP